MSPRATMRPNVLLSLVVLLVAATATVPLVSAVCISRYEKSESKNEATAAAAAGGEHGTPKKLYEMSKEEDPYVGATTAKASTAYDKPVQEAQAASFSTADAKSDKYEEVPTPKKVKKEKSDDSDVSSYLKKEKKEKSDDLDELASPKKEKKEKSDDSDVSAYLKKEKKKFDDMDELASPKKEKKEKSDDSDVSAYLKKQKKKSGDSDKKEEKKQSDDLDELASPKKEKKEKSDDSDESSLSSKKKKKNKSDGSDEYVSPKKEKKEKSDDDLDKDSSSKKEKKEKSIDADASAYVKKEKKEKAKKKEKSNDYSKDKEKSDEDAMPVDVSSSGEYVSSPKEDKSNEDATPVDVSTSGQYVSPQKNIPDELPPAAKSSTTSDAYSSQPIGGSPDELPPATKSSTTSDAYSSQPMGSAPDELPPATKSSATTSDAYASPKQYASQQPMGGAPDELPPATKSSDPYAGQPNEPGKPKVSVETFGGMIKKPLMNTLSPVIKRVCGRTSFPDDCEASIADLPGGGVVPPQTDAIGVLKLAMEAVKQKAIEAMNAATDRMNAPGIDPIIKEVLDSCTSAYSDIKSSLDVVDAALKRGDFDTARTNLDSVETDVGTCDDGFAERETPSVMSDHDVELKKLGSDLIAIGTNFFHH